MKGPHRAVKAYRLPDGSCPMKLWRQTIQDLYARKAIDIRIDRTAMGNVGDCKSVGEGVYELRIDYGPGYRVYFAYEGETILLLLIGGDKATQKQDIKTAQRYLWNYREQPE